MAQAENNREKQVDMPDIDLDALATGRQAAPVSADPQRWQGPNSHEDILTQVYQQPDYAAEAVALAGYYQELEQTARERKSSGANTDKLDRRMTVLRQEADRLSQAIMEEKAPIEEKWDKYNGETKALDGLLSVWYHQERIKEDPTAKFGEVSKQQAKWWENTVSEAKFGILGVPPSAEEIVSSEPEVASVTQGQFAQGQERIQDLINYLQTSRQQLVQEASQAEQAEATPEEESVISQTTPAKPAKDASTADQVFDRLLEAHERLHTEVKTASAVQAATPSAQGQMVDELAKVLSELDKKTSKTTTGETSTGQPKDSATAQTTEQTAIPLGPRTTGEASSVGQADQTTESGEAEETGSAIPLGPATSERNPAAGNRQPAQPIHEPSTTANAEAATLSPEERRALEIGQQVLREQLPAGMSYEWDPKHQSLIINPHEERVFNFRPISRRFRSALERFNPRSRSNQPTATERRQGRNWTLPIVAGVLMLGAVAGSWWWSNQGRDGAASVLFPSSTPTAGLSGAATAEVAAAASTNTATTTATATIEAVQTPSAYTEGVKAAVLAKIPSSQRAEANRILDSQPHLVADPGAVIDHQPNLAETNALAHTYDQGNTFWRYNPQESYAPGIEGVLEAQPGNNEQLIKLFQTNPDYQVYFAQRNIDVNQLTTENVVGLDTYQSWRNGKLVEEMKARGYTVSESSVQSVMGEKTFNMYVRVPETGTMAPFTAEMTSLSDENVQLIREMFPGQFINLHSLDEKFYMVEVNGAYFAIPYYCVNMPVTGLPPTTAEITPTASPTSALTATPTETPTATPTQGAGGGGGGGGGGGETPTPESTATPNTPQGPTSVPTSTPGTKVPETSTPFSTVTPFPTETPIPGSTPTPENTATPVYSPTPEATDTPVPTNTPMPTTTPFYTATPKPPQPPTSVATSTPGKEVPPTSTPFATVTPYGTETPLPGSTPTPPNTPTRVPAPTATEKAYPTATPKPPQRPTSVPTSVPSTEVPATSIPAATVTPYTAETPLPGSTATPNSQPTAAQSQPTAVSGVTPIAPH